MNSRTQEKGKRFLASIHSLPVDSCRTANRLGVAFGGRRFRLRQLVALIAQHCLAA